MTMQKAGRKSKVIEMVIPNLTNPGTPYIVKVQANKNHGICNIIQGTKIPQEIVDSKTKKKRKIMKFFPSCHLSNVLSTFQGRQYDDPQVFEALENTLNLTLNSYE